MTTTNTKVPLPAFLQVLSAGGMTVPSAMAVAGKIYKAHNTPAALGKLTDLQLKTLGVESKEDRKFALTAFRKAGYRPTGGAAAETAGGGSIATTSSAGAGTSAGSVHKGKKPTVRKRKRDDDVNELLPDGPRNEGATLGSLEFNEVLDEEVLKTKSVVVNRAPVMSAWATVVAERLGFKREEALSIASAYTEMNAISKGVSLGIFEQSKGKGVEIVKGTSQPYVDLMGRSPVYTTRSGDWRALVKGEPVDPASAFSYMSRAFRQTMPFVLGSMRLLADSYSPQALNQKGFSLYADFRPEAEAWGKRAEMRCSNILSLRNSTEKTKDEEDARDSELPPRDAGNKQEPEQERTAKKLKVMSVEEYEALLDAENEEYSLDGDF